MWKIQVKETEKVLVSRAFQTRFEAQQEIWTMEATVRAWTNGLRDINDILEPIEVS